MSAYLIAHKNTDDLDTIVFDGEAGQEIVAVFSDPKKAEKYINDAGWNDTYTVATLDAIAFMEWLIKCHRSGIEIMMTDPDRDEQESGRRLNTMNIEAHLNAAGEHIVLIANPDF